MSSHTKEQLEQMLFDVVDQLDLSDGMIEEHGPHGTPPAKLVRLVLDRKDRTIKLLQQGFKDAGVAAPAPSYADSLEQPHADKFVDSVTSNTATPVGWMFKNDCLSPMANNYFRYGPRRPDERASWIPLYAAPAHGWISARAKMLIAYMDAKYQRGMPISAEEVKDLMAAYHEMQDTSHPRESEVG